MYKGRCGPAMLPFAQITLGTFSVVQRFSNNFIASMNVPVEQVRRFRMQPGGRQCSPAVGTRAGACSRLDRRLCLQRAHCSATTARRFVYPFNVQKDDSHNGRMGWRNCNRVAVEQKFYSRCTWTDLTNARSRVLHQCISTRLELSVTLLLDA